MKFACLLQLACIVLSSVIICSNGSKIVLQSSPSEIKDGLTRTMTLRCSLNDTAASASVVGRRDVSQTSDNVAEVSSIIVMRNGKDIASISHNVAAKVMDGSTNTHVTGSVPGRAGEMAFLEMTFTYPTVNDTGEYQCEIGAVHGGHTIVFSSTTEVNFSTPTIADLVSHIRDHDKAHDKALDEIKSQINTAVLFSVGSTKELTIPQGHTVLYDKTYVNLGGGYNEKTGEFVCTTPGYYHFSFSAYIDTNRPHVFFILYHNTETAFAMYGTIRSTDINEMLSNSGILKLARGDVVKVVAFDSSHFYNNDRDVYATFSGHLLSMV